MRLTKTARKDETGLTSPGVTVCERATVAQAKVKAKFATAGAVAGDMAGWLSQLHRGLSCTADHHGGCENFSSTWNVCDHGQSLMRAAQRPFARRPASSVHKGASKRIGTSPRLTTEEVLDAG